MTIFDFLTDSFCYFSDKLIISDPVEYHDRSFMAHLNQLPWSEPLFTRRVEQTVLTGKHMTFCRVSNESISVVKLYLLYFCTISIYQLLIFLFASLYLIGC